MQSKLLVKMQNEANSLERVMAKVRESEFQVRNLNARLSLDETLFFLTMEVEGEVPMSELSTTLQSLSEVRSVELSSAC